MINGAKNRTTPLPGWVLSGFSGIAMFVVAIVVARVICSDDSAGCRYLGKVFEAANAPLRFAANPVLHRVASLLGIEYLGDMIGYGGTRSSNLLLDALRWSLLLGYWFSIGTLFRALYRLVRRVKFTSQRS